MIIRRSIIRILITAAVIVVALLAGGLWWAYKTLEVVQPTYVGYISAEKAEELGIDFSQYREYGVYEVSCEPLSRYVRELGYAAEEARCAFALKGHQVDHFEPLQWHGVYLTVYLRRAEPERVYIYTYDSRYAGAWFGRGNRVLPDPPASPAP